MDRNRSRPLSPHLFDQGLRLHWRWGPHMLVSILHRATGVTLSTAGAIVLVWWLTAAATDADYYNYFVGHATSWYGTVIAVGLSWAFFMKATAGIRHLVMDIGAGFEITTNKFWALMSIAIATAITALFWLYVMVGR